jgi:UDP-N-acetylmuramoyl-tripeptide--D-alanyl-D-alanine ligase
MSAGEIARACGGSLLRGAAETVACGVCTDTRTLRSGEAFFALKGARFDAHDFLPAAAATGAAVLVVSRRSADPSETGDCAVMRVADTEAALLAVAAHHRAALSARIAAVTGSYGKSTVKGMLGAILACEGTCTTARGSFNNRIGVALTLLDARAGDDFVVLEMGTNHAGEIDELAAAARPDLGVITAIGEVHLEGLGDLDGVRAAKAELIDHLTDGGILVLNADDPRCASLRDRFAGRTVTFGESDAASMQVEDVRRTADGWEFTAAGCAFRIPSGARHDAMNAAAALCAGREFGVAPERAADALAEAERPPMRYERVDVEGVTFIRDCYNSNPAAFRSALASFMLESNPGRKIVVCGDMLELGDRGPALHEGLGADLAGAGVDVLVGVGPLASNVVEGWRAVAPPSRPALWFRSAADAWEPLWWEVTTGDAVLLKGSRLVGLETITDRIAGHVQSDRGREAAA